MPYAECYARLSEGKDRVFRHRLVLWANSTPYRLIFAGLFPASRAMIDLCLYELRCRQVIEQDAIDAQPGVTLE